MSLDFTAPGRHNPEPHWRRYLDAQDRVVVVCVQDFDYCDYTTERFVDSAVFDTEAEAKAAPILISPLFAAIELAPTGGDAAQAALILRAVLRSNGVTA